MFRQSLLTKYHPHGTLTLSTKEVLMPDLTTAEVAKLLSDREHKSVKPDTVKHWCLQGRFPNARRVGSANRGNWLIPQSDLDCFTLPPIGRPTKE